jgi:S1-C subfamily serine protease
MAPVPFCERNIKGWIALLAVVAVAVLVMSGWMAYQGKGGVAAYRHMWGKAKATNLAGPPPPNAGPPSPAQPVAYLRPTSPAPYVPTASPVGQPPVDTVARATSGGGIRFVGRGLPNADHGNAFNRAASNIRPAVVSISAIRGAPPSRYPADANRVQFLDPFDGVPDRVIGQQSFEAVGSGVIVDPAGFVVTNRHVIEGAGVVLVSLPSSPDTHLSAQIVAADANDDLALLKIPATVPLPSAVLGDSSLAEVGDWVLAVGYPFGLQLTVTSGIVGGRGVALEIGGRPYRGLLQTDAPINKGSSGGPLVDLNGEVIGINTAIYAPTGVFSGTGFAIPSNRVGAFVARTMDRGAVLTAAPQPPPSVSVAWLGLGLVDVSSDLGRQLGFPYAGGAYVASVVLDSPAEDAEVIRGDIVTSLADRAVLNVDSIQNILSELTPGQVVPITVWRRNKTITVMMRLRGG